MDKVDVDHLRFALEKEIENLRSDTLLAICHALYDPRKAVVDHGKLTVAQANHIAKLVETSYRCIVARTFGHTQWLMDDPELQAIVAAYREKKFADMYPEAASSPSYKAYIKKYDKPSQEAKRRRDQAVRFIANFYAGERDDGATH